MLGTITNIPSAIQWLKSTYLYIRAKKNPSFYGVPAVHAATVSSIESWLTKTYLLQNVELLVQNNFASSDEEGYELNALQPGIIMAEHYMSLQTMIGIVGCKQGATIEDLLWVIAKSNDFCSIMIRRGEKKFLNSVNANQFVKYHVMDQKKNQKYCRGYLSLVKKYLYWYACIQGE